MIKIGPYSLKEKVFLAPLAGCADLAFRLIAREHGAGFCFFEMTDCNSLVRGPERNIVSTFRTTEADRPIAAQLVGSDPSMMARAAKRIFEFSKPSFIDINAACPTKKVVKKGAGARLLTDKNLLFNIVKTISLNAPVPVTVKIRVGYDKRDVKNITVIAKGCEENGASAIFVHGRTRSQGYCGGIDYESIKAIKEAVKVPVFGSGNIFDGESAAAMLKNTGCDGITVARGALGNPWIFKEIENYLAGKEAPSKIGMDRRKSVLIRHLGYLEKYKMIRPSGKAGFMRKVAIWYLKGFPKAARLREKIIVVKSYEEMLKLIDSIGC